VSEASAGRARARPEPGIFPCGRDGFVRWSLGRARHSAGIWVACGEWGLVESDNAGAPPSVGGGGGRSLSFPAAGRNRSKRFFGDCFGSFASGLVEVRTSTPRRKPTRFFFFVYSRFGRPGGHGPRVLPTPQYFAGGAGGFSAKRRLGDDGAKRDHPLGVAATTGSFGGAGAQDKAMLAPDTGRSSSPSSYGPQPHR